MRSTHIIKYYLLTYLRNYIYFLSSFHIHITCA